MQGFVFQYFKCFITDLSHNPIDAAVGLVLTLGAGFVVVETDTGEQGNWAVEEPNHSGKWDVFGFFDEVVATAFSLFATEVAGLSEFEEDIFEKLM